MSWLIAIIVGGIVGWIANYVMGRRGNLLTDIIFGIIGAVISRWFFGSVLGIGSALAAGTFSALGILWGIIGAVILIAIVRAIASTDTEQKSEAYYQEIRRKERERKERDYEDRDKMGR